MRFSRRKILQGAAAAAVTESLPIGAAPAPRKWPIEEGPDTRSFVLHQVMRGPLPESLRSAAAPNNSTNRQAVDAEAPGVRADSRRAPAV
jgi:hypothetical protein